MQLALDAEYRRMQNEWFFKWHHIGGDSPVEIDSFDGRVMRYGGTQFWGTPRQVYWETIQRYLRQKIVMLFKELEVELTVYPTETRRRSLDEARRLIKQFVAKIRSAAVEKDRVLRGNGFELPQPQGLGKWQETQPAEIDMRVEELTRLYCDLDVVQREGYMLDHMLNDRVTLVKEDGTINRDSIPSLVTKGKIQIHDATIPIEVGDHLLRKLPSGLVEDYVVDDPVLHAGIGTVKAFYIVEVTRSSQPTAQPQSVIQSITNHFHGSNSRVNINTTDQSINVSSNVQMERIQPFLDQVKALESALPAEVRTEIAPSIALLETELRSGNPSQAQMIGALSSIKNVAEGAMGNLVASGIVALAASLLGT